MRIFVAWNLGYKYGSFFLLFTFTIPHILQGLAVVCKTSKNTHLFSNFIEVSTKYLIILNKQPENIHFYLLWSLTVYQTEKYKFLKIYLDSELGNNSMWLAFFVQIISLTKFKKKKILFKMCLPLFQ